MNGFGHDLRGQGLEGPDIQGPYPSAVGGGDHDVFLGVDDQVLVEGGGKVPAGESVPFAATVHGDVDPQVGPDIEDVRVLRGLP